MYRRTFHGYYVQKYVHHKIGIYISKKVRRFKIPAIPTIQKPKNPRSKVSGKGIFQVHQIGKMVRTHEVSGPKAAIFWGVGSPAIPQRPLINLAVD